MHGTERLRGKETRLYAPHGTQRSDRLSCRLYIYTHRTVVASVFVRRLLAIFFGVCAPHSLLVINGERRNSQLRRDSSRHHPSSARGLPQVRLQGPLSITSFLLPHDRDHSLFLLLLQVEFWICLLLTLFGYLPGIIYAVYAITK
ncbi:hypothetical protein GW17_00042687 [Ensete ventricosum]|nr:hypothetical protein GW17_00042687 [Ensete ventricosum]